MISPDKAEVLLSRLVSWDYVRQTERVPVCEWRGPPGASDRKWVRSYAQRRLGTATYWLPNELADASLQEAPSVLDGLRAVSEAALEVRLGVGVPTIDVRDWNLWARVWTLIDPDVVACAHPELGRAPRTDVSWPPFVVGAKPTDADVVDLHVHLGNMLTPRDTWLAHMAGLFADGLAARATPREQQPDLPTRKQDMVRVTRAGACLRWRLLHLVCGCGAKCPVCHTRPHHHEGRRDVTAALAADHGVSRRWDPGSIELKRDPLEAMAPADWQRHHPHFLERRLLVEAFRLGRKGESLLERYLRCRAVFWRTAVVSAERSGFEWFQRVFRVSRPRFGARVRLKRGWERYRTYRGLVDLGLSGCGRLEPRVRPSPNKRELLVEARAWLRGLRAVLSEREEHQALGLEPPQARFVLHFIRTNEKRRRGEPEDYGAEPDRDPNPKKLEREARAVTDLVLRRPDMGEFFVAVDIAGVEFDTVTAAYAKAYNEVDLVGGLEKTVHAGEEWRELMSGIRECHIAMKLLGARRIGHGFALLEPPERRYQPGRCVELPRWERALNLVWELWLYRKGLLPPSPRIGILEVSLRDGLKATVPDDLKPVWENGIGPRSIAEMLKLAKPTTLDSRNIDQDEAGWVRLVQERVLTIARDEKVLLEVCPSSNLRVRGLGRYEDHPLLLHPASCPQVAICSDNPGLFAVTARTEIATMEQACRRLGRTPDEAREWRDTVAKNSQLRTFLRLMPDGPAAFARADLGRLSRALNLRSSAPPRFSPRR